MFPKVTGDHHDEKTSIAETVIHHPPSVLYSKAAHPPILSYTILDYVCDNCGWVKHVLQVRSS